MAQQSFLDKVREWIGGVAWSIFLWSARMTEDEYFAEQDRVAEQRDAPEQSGGWICNKCKTVNRDGISDCGFCDTPRFDG